MSLLYVWERRIRLGFQFRFASVVDADSELARVREERDTQELAAMDRAVRYAACLPQELRLVD